MNSKEVIYSLDKFLNSLSTSPKKNTKTKSIGHSEEILFLFEKFEISLSDFQFINVVGTSGKGSTAMMISQCLFCSAKSVGAFFSPHISSITERFWFQGDYVKSKLIMKVYDKFFSIIKEIIEDPKQSSVTFFESTFVLFLLLAKELNCKILVLEAGIGGTYDVTRMPLFQKLSVVTKIALDHTELLGKNITEITRDKAGVIAENGQVILSKNHYLVKREISRVAKKRSAKFYSAPVAQEIESKKYCTSFNLEFADGFLMKNLSIPMHGKHQVNNAAVAVGACKLMDLDDLSITKGLAKSFLPGRAEIVSENPTVILDIAHNRNKINALLEFLKKKSKKKLFFIVGFLEGKDIGGMVEEFSKIKGVFFLTLPPSFGIRKNVSIDKLNSIFMKNKIDDFRNYIEPEDALKEALRIAEKDDLVVVTGSTYLVGELRKFWLNEEIIL